MSVKEKLTALASAVRDAVGINNYAMRLDEMEQLIRNIPDSSYMRKLIEKDMTTLVVPGVYRYIRASFMRSAPNLTSVTLLSGITNIFDSAFSECENLTSISLPNTLTTIGNEVFWSSGLTTITLPASLRFMGQYALGDCPISAIVIPEGVTSLSGGLFQGCENLASVTLPSSLLSIGSGAFEFCNNLRSIVLPANLTSIGSQALSSALSHVYCRFGQGVIPNAPWGAHFAQIHYNYTGA